MGSVREAIDKAATELDVASEGIGYEQTEVFGTDVPRAEPEKAEEPTESDAAIRADRARDERGRFSVRDAAKLLQNQDGEGSSTGEAGTSPKAAPEPGRAATANQQPSDTAPSVDPDEVKIQATPAYQDLGDEWNKLPRAIQERLILRDNQRDTATNRALAEAKRLKEGWEPIEAVFGDEDKKILQAMGTNTAQATKNLWNAHKNLDANPDAGILFMAHQYNINRVGVAAALLGGEAGLKNLLHHFAQTGQIPFDNSVVGPPQRMYNGPAAEIDPRDDYLRSLEERLNQVSSTVEQLNGTAQQQKLESLSDQLYGMMQETDANGAPVRPWMAEIVDDVLAHTRRVIDEVKANQAPPGVSDIRSAVDEGYRRAVRLNPITYARILDSESQRGAARQTTNQQHKTQSARIAGKQVSGAPGSVSSQMPSNRLERIKFLARQSG